ncbi:MAG: peptidoglycan-binding protein [Pseudomonadota bacterium]
MAQPASSPPAQFALVIGNAAYGAGPALTPLPGCLASARRVGAALRALGFEVMQRLDASRGEADAAVANFGRRLRAAPGSVGVAYVCGHVVAFNSRPFLLPVSATLLRETDVLTQGLLARGVADALLRGEVRAGLVAFDGIAPSSAVGVLESFRTLAEPAGNAGVGVVAAVTDGAGEQTPLALALEGSLTGPSVLLADVLTALRARVPDGLTILASPTTPGHLAGEPVAVVEAAPPMNSVPASAPTATPRPPESEQPTATAAGPGPVSTPPAPGAAAPQPSALIIPDEAAMTDADRRRVQQALAAMGYYLGAPDGQFGPNTRAAIRRFQFEIGVTLTGTLSSAQASRLVAGR